MFNALEALPPDPILGLTASFRQDPRAFKIDLGVGVYKTEDGQTPVMRAIKAAEQQFYGQENTKSYIAQVGVESYNDGMVKLILGEGHGALRDNRVR